MATIEELMHANLAEVFNERDAERRRAAIARTYVPGVEFSDPDGQAAVFTGDGAVRLFEADPAVASPVRTITGRAELATTFGDLVRQYDTTTYLNGQGTASVTGHTATGETYCLAYHLLHEDGERVLLTMAIRYLNSFERTTEGWRIGRRDLVFDWTDRRPSTP